MTFSKNFKSKKAAFLTIIIIAMCVLFYGTLVKPMIEVHTWELSTAQQVAPFLTIAHNPDYDFSDDHPLWALSKPVDLILVAENGKLTITDKTNNKIYSGNYKVELWSKFLRQGYEIMIEGKTGTANISNGSFFNPTSLFMSIDGYCLNFEISR